MANLNQSVYYQKIGTNDVQEENPQKLQINETKGERAIQGKVSNGFAPDYTQPLKMKKQNIGIEEAPKMAIIGNYWD